MDSVQFPLTRDLVLIGGGHAHALVLRRWGMNRLPGARLTVISPEPMAAYSGMLPGYVAGHYPREALDIDLVRLARFAGARLVLGAATNVDLAARQVSVPGRPPVAFDVCSVDVGITSAMPNLPGFAEHAIPAKPLDRFADSWRTVIEGSGPVRIAVIGAGVAGAELAMAMSRALRARGRNGQVTLIDAADALPGLGARAARAVRDGLAAQGVTLIERTGATAVEPGVVLLADGRRIEADFVTGAAGAQPHDWLAQTGLELDNGFIAVNDRLQTSDSAVFAAGDCAHMAASPRPKAGVYAVRQAPVLFDNLRAALSGGRMRRYRPQRDYLKLISLGDKVAVGERLGLAMSGPAMWRWKDRIDNRFMDRFRDLPAMGLPELPEPRAQGMDQAMDGKPLCGGCGAKVGRRALRGALQSLANNTRPDITPLPGDDAALLRTGGTRQVLSSDHLRAFVDDPVMMTRIAAVHALGDIWAMGAAPQAATANLILPRLSAELQERTLREIMAAATGIMHGAGAEIVGGHSSVGAELTIGFSVTGLCGHEPITLAGGRVGDALILTKPIGTGVVMAGEMAGQARGDHVVAALRQMARSQAEAARVLAGAHAMTDVTGFGLAGHLLNICEASGTGAMLAPEAVPLLDGAAELSARGVRSSLWADNRAAVPSLPDGGIADLLFDPQTAGGLLAAVPRGEVDRILAALHWLGFPAARIGALTDGPPYPVAGPLPA